MTPERVEYIRYFSLFGEIMISDIVQIASFASIFKIGLLFKVSSTHDF